MKNFIDEKTEVVIGLNYLVNQMNLQSAYGKKHMYGVTPYTSLKKDELLIEYELLSTIIENVKAGNMENIDLLVHKFKDIVGILNNCKLNKTLDIVDLYEIKIQAIYMNQLKELLNIPSLVLKDCSSIINILSPQLNQITFDFYLYNSYSDNLRQIREEKRKLEHQFFREKSDVEKEKIKRKRSELVILEEEEELRIRKILSSKIKNEIYLMFENINIIGHLDFLLAKAKLAIKYSCIKPYISINQLKFESMINPYIKDKVEESGNYYTQNSILVTNGTTVLTGANMSGKSSVLKTVLLNVLLGHLGFFVCAKEADIPLFDNIIYIGGETENFIHGLSSFGLEIAYINNAIKAMKSSRCLICVDEFARSTNPSEGQKFVKAFASFANSFESFTMLATHYDGVVNEKMNHYQIVGLKDEVMKYKKINSIKDIHRFMDYSLKKVSLEKEVPKEAYNVSILLDIDSDFKEYLDKSYEE